MILYTRLQRLMGRKLLTEEGLGVLGIRTMRELLTSLGILGSVKNDVTA